MASGGGSSGSLEKSLVFTDLISFGIASIMGSGGFNLIGEAIAAAGPWTAGAIALVSALFQGASKVYEEAFNAFKSNTSESDVVRQELGTGAEFVSMIGILFFNVFSVSTILVFAAKTIFPKGLWAGQISVALGLLGLMSGFALKGIDMNKYVISLFSTIITLLLLAASAIGLIEGFGPTGTDASTWPSALSGTPDFKQSVLYIYFILAGFDVLMKFTQEAIDPEKDIPRSFYVSNAMSTLLTTGVAYAFIHALTLKRYSSVPKDNVLGVIFDSFFGPPAGSIAHSLSIGLMIVTAFVTLLGTSRYLYSLAKESKTFPEGWKNWLDDLNEEKVPVNTVLITLGLAATGILLNHTSSLVRLSDFFLTLVMFLVSVAVSKLRAGRGEFPAIEAATALGFGALLMTCCF